MMRQVVSESETKAEAASSSAAQDLLNDLEDEDDEAATPAWVSSDSIDFTCYN